MLFALLFFHHANSNRIYGQTHLANIFLNIYAQYSLRNNFNNRVKKESSNYLDEHKITFSNQTILVEIFGNFCAKSAIFV